MNGQRHDHGRPDEHEFARQDALEKPHVNQNGRDDGDRVGHRDGRQMKLVAQVASRVQAPVPITASRTMYDAISSSDPTTKRRSSAGAASVP